MLHIDIKGGEFFNEDSQTFIYVEPQRIDMEHSLLAISEWESIWKKSFFDDPKTWLEFLDYIRCMALKPINTSVFNSFTDEDYKKITDYMNDTHTATVIRSVDQNRKNSGRKTTSELIYYYMAVAGIPFECERWNIHRLLTLIRIYSIEQNPKKSKMSRNAVMQQNRELNAIRKAKYNTHG